MNWFDTNPYGDSASMMKKASWGVHRFGRQQFVSNFARNGMSATLFAPTPKAAFSAVMGRTYEKGSPKHISNLKNLAARYPENPNISNALNEARKKGWKPKTLAKKALGLGAYAASGAFYGLTFATTEGTIADKSKATISEMIGVQAFKPGAAVGAAIGTAVLPVIGTAIGALAGGIAAQFGVSAAVDYGFKTTDRMVQRERDRRNLNWVGDKTAFNTQNAYTMRQQSLAAMNRGMATGRSALGREAIMVHR